jgi:hypothetical protein
MGWREFMSDLLTANRGAHLPEQAASRRLDG